VFENAVACALQREVRLTEDLTGRRASLGFLRDKEKREVDFIVALDRKPRQLVEVKLADDTFSKPLESLPQNVPQRRGSTGGQVARVFER
jgi:hypothetical protein